MKAKPTTNRAQSNSGNNPPPKPPKRSKENNNNKKKNIIDFLKEKNIDDLVKAINDGTFTKVSLVNTSFEKLASKLNHFQIEPSDQLIVFQAIKNSVSTFSGPREKTAKDMVAKCEKRIKELDNTIKVANEIDNPKSPEAIPAVKTQKEENTTAPQEQPNNDVKKEPKEEKESPKIEEAKSEDTKAEVEPSEPEKQEPKGKEKETKTEETQSEAETQIEASEAEETSIEETKIEENPTETKLSDSEENPPVGTTEDELRLSSTRDQITPIVEEILKKEEEEKILAAREQASQERESSASSAPPIMPPLQIEPKGKESMKEKTKEKTNSGITIDLVEIKRWISDSKVENIAKNKDWLISSIKTSVSDHEQQQELFGSLLTRIGGLKQKTTAIELLKAAIAFEKGKSILDQYKDNKDPAVKHDNYSKGLKFCDIANIVCVENQLEDGFSGLSTEILSSIAKTIKDYDHDQYAYELATESLKTRTDKGIDENSHTMFNALKSAAQTGLKVAVSDNAELTAEIYTHCARALNICTELGVNRSDIYNTMQSLHSLIGDAHKADILKKLADLYKSDKSDVKEEESNLTPTIKFGLLTAEDLRVKQAIQDNILNPIYEQAQNGKWYENKAGAASGFVSSFWGSGATEYGISGYITKEFLQKYLVPAGLEQDHHVETALKFCFETINLAIVHSANKNPLCSAIFVQTYPDLVESMLKEHPEFFVDKFILETSIAGAHTAAKELTGVDIAENGTFNKHFETAILSFIHERLDATLFTPIHELIAAKNWNESAASQLTTYLSEEYLTTSSVGNSHLGRNLGEMKDIMKIIHVDSFKTILETIKGNQDGNNAPLVTYFTALSKFYKDAAPEILDRIKGNHSELFINDKTTSSMVYTAHKIAFPEMDNIAPADSEEGNNHSTPQVFVKPTGGLGDASMFISDIVPSGPSGVELGGASHTEEADNI